MSNKRILYVITMAELGGAQRYVFDLAMAGAKNGHDIYVATGREGKQDLIKKLQENEIKTITLNHLIRPISPKEDIKAVFELKKVYQNIKPDIIHLNSTKAGIIGSLSSLIYSRKLQATNYKLIYTAHGWVFNEPMSFLKKQLFFWLEKLTAGVKNKIICVSEFDRQVATRKNISSPEKLIAIHNGIDADSMVFLNREEAKKELFKDYDLEIIDQKPIIGTLANFYPTKGLEYFIEAIKILVKDKHIEVMGAIMGDGELRPQLENLIRQYDLEKNFILLGQKANGSVYLKAFDLYICSSVKEGFPYSILEAMASELPIITTGVGGIPEIIQNNKNGLTAQTKNSADLAEKIQYLINHQERAKEFIEQAQKDLREKFSQDEMIKKTFECYE